MVCDGIYVTLGADQLKEKPYKEQIETFLKCDGENYVFYWRLGNKPKHDFQWVYIVVGNKVRWRARFVQYVDGGKVQFTDGREIIAKKWMLLIDFEPLTKPHEMRKGFQGFRYKLD